MISTCSDQPPTPFRTRCSCLILLSTRLYILFWMNGSGGSYRECSVTSWHSEYKTRASLPNNTPHVTYTAGACLVWHLMAHVLKEYYRKDWRVNSTLNFTRKTDIARVEALESHSLSHLSKIKETLSKSMSMLFLVLLLEWFPQVFWNLNINSRFGKHTFSVNSLISKVLFPSTSYIFVFRVSYDSYNFCSRLTSAISLHAEVQFHAKYPLFDRQSDRQSDREFTLSYAIISHINSSRTVLVIVLE